MLRFDDLQLFVRAADLGSLSAAARVMDLSPAVASAALKRIEQQLGTRLLARSTRSLRLTAEGEGFLEYARASLSALDEGRRLLASGQDQVSGVLQLSAPSDFGRNQLLPWRASRSCHASNIRSYRSSMSGCHRCCANCQRNLQP